MALKVSDEKHNTTEGYPHRMSLSPIDRLLSSISTESSNRISGTYLDIRKNEFLLLDSEIVIPRIHASELDYSLGESIVASLQNYIPEYLADHRLLQKRMPASDQHSLHFIKKMKGKLIDLSHIFRIDFKFQSGYGDIIESGGSDFFPSYSTSKVFFKSRLIPELTLNRGTNGTIFPIKLRETDHIESDQYFHTYALFEELNESEISRKLSAMAGEKLYRISFNLFPFISYDLFSAALNVLNPVDAEIDLACSIFEPLFLYIYSRHRNLAGLINTDCIEEYHGESLSYIKGSLQLSRGFRDVLAEYFGRFTLVRDDELALKGWWKFETGSK